MPSAWITHAKKYAAENNVSYKEALSKASASYKKQEGEGFFDKCKRGTKQNKIHPEKKYKEPKKIKGINKKTGKVKYFETDTAEPEVEHQRRNSNIPSIGF